MKFDTPATTNPIDQGKVVGKATDRIDGPLKASGTAPYAYERHDVVPNQAYGYIVGAGIGKGKIALLDDSAARKAPGVLAVVSAKNAGKLGRATSTPPRCLADPTSSTITRRSPSSLPKPSNRRARPRAWSASTTRAARGGSTSPPRRIRRSSRSHKAGSTQCRTPPSATSTAHSQPRQ